MKRFILLFTMILTLFLVSCGSKEAEVQSYYTSIDQVTLESILDMTRPINMLKDDSAGVRLLYATYADESSSDVVYEYAISYQKSGDLYEYNEIADYPDGSYAHLYFSTDPSDEKLYIASSIGNETRPMDTATAQDIFNSSILSYESYSSTLSSVEEKDGTYVATIEVNDENGLLAIDTLIIDPLTGHILNYQTLLYNVDTINKLNIQFSYSSDLVIDRSPKELASDSVSSTLQFTTTDINGQEVTSDILKNAKVIMINFWEPWCGPCVSEMPELEKLYENYQDKGFLILGVFSSSDDDAKAIINDKGITYPILHQSSEFYPYTTEYVPTTIFVNNEGELLSNEPVIGANTYDTWESILTSYLN